MSQNKKAARPKRQPGFGESIFAFLLLLILIGVGYLGFRLRVELLMLAAAAGVALMAMRNGYTWAELEHAMSQRLGRSTPVIMIFWSIGIVIATFIFSGSLPMAIYYGIIHVSPKYVILAAFLACILFSTLTGMSWGSAGTVGVAFMGIAVALHLPLHITAGAVICGATFGDKMSPLSDTTNLCASTSGVDVYEHIRSMLWTTLPPSIIAGLVFFFVGHQLDIATDTMPDSALEMVRQLDSIYTWSFWVIVPYLIILGGALLKKPPVPTMLLGSFVALLVGVFLQKFSLYNGVDAALNGFKVGMIPGVGELSATTKSLLSRGGIKSMVGVVVVVYCGYAYASIVSKAGFLEQAVKPLAEYVKSRFSIIAATLFTEGVLLAACGSSYPAAILVPEMFKKLFLKARLPARVLSRSLEDVGTICAAFFPWAASGAFYVAALGVDIYGANGFAPWFITGYLTPLFSLFYAATGIGLYIMSDKQAADELEEYEAELQTM